MTKRSIGQALRQINHCRDRKMDRRNESKPKLYTDLLNNRTKLIARE